MKSLSYIGSFLTILISIHYFYSYRILYGLLKVHHLEDKSIITFEDITFPLGNVNFMILAISSFGLIWIYLWHLLIDNEEDFRLQVKDAISSISKKFPDRISRIFGRGEKRYSNLRSIMFLVFFVIMIVFFILGYNSKLDKLSLFLINFLLIPGLYIFKKKKRVLVMLTYFGIMLLFGIFFIDNSIKSSEKKVQENSNDGIKETLSFNYNSKSFKTSQDTIVIFNGYKYLILKTNSKKIYDLIPKEEITDLRVQITDNN